MRRGLGLLLQRWCAVVDAPDLWCVCSSRFEVLDYCCVMMNEGVAVMVILVHGKKGRGCHGLRFAHDERRASAGSMLPCEMKLLQW